jgi:hypothetical protein
MRSHKYHPQTIGGEERFHGSLKLEHLYRVLPRNRTELIEAVKAYRFGSEVAEDYFCDVERS